MAALLGAASSLHAQQNNNQYFQEQQRIQQQQHNAEQARQGYMHSQQEANRANGHWVTMWGALATDGARGVLGAANNMADQQSAEANALAQCRSNGGNPCVIDASYANQCTALVTGDKIFNVHVGKTEQEAASKGLAKCKSAGDANCRVYFSACSLPKFVNN